jgi:hypothetical protein
LYYRLADQAPQTLKVLSLNQLQDVWRQAFNNKVAGLDDGAKLAKYDPTGIIGFCFGRAMTAHLLARRMGLKAESIAKLFIVGDLRSGANPEWRFHVTTLARGPHKRWYAIDPILDGPMPVEDWISRVERTWDKRRQAQLYLLEPSAIIPDLSQVPDPDKETGQRLIELSFDPTTHPGFTPEPALGARAYRLTAQAAQRYFSSVDETPSFDFSGITINEGPISYNSYFDELLDDIATPRSVRSAAQAVRALAMEVPLKHARVTLGLNIQRLTEMQSDAR